MKKNYSYPILGIDSTGLSILGMDGKVKYKSLIQKKNKMSREIGDELEDLISTDLGLNKTTNSGAKFDNGDLTDKKLIVEAKVKSKPSFSIPKGELSKLKKQAEKHSKDWIYIQKNLSGTYVLMDYNTFLELTEAWFIKNKKA